MNKKKIMSLVISVLILMTLFAGCKKDPDVKKETVNDKTNTAQKQNNSSDTTKDEKEIVDVEVWNTNSGFKAIEKGDAGYNFAVKHTGVGFIQPYVEWDGGTNYLNQLNLKITAGEMPDMFKAYGGIEAELAVNGALADLTDLLPEYAPNLWNQVPEDVWNIVKANDPTGEGRIYWIPKIVTYARMGGLIRQDWLDKLGLDMPTTQDEFVQVLKAFKEQDPNGNGDADELPTGGRADARWMDHLFLMYGVAMDEGFPDWDIYDGELTFSAVTPNMRDAIAFCRDLYKEGLMDPETFLNSKGDWTGKILADRVGVYYHWVQSVSTNELKIEANTGNRPYYNVLPAIEVPGYEGQSFYMKKEYAGPQWCVKANTKNEKKLMATLQLLNAMYDPEKQDIFDFGIEGINHEVVDGKKVKLPQDKSKQYNLNLGTRNQLATIEGSIDKLKLRVTDENKWTYDHAFKNVKENQKYAKSVAGSGLPVAIMLDYPDIKNNTLYKEYVSKIIIGEYTIEKFDEFVEKWYATGGDKVTEKAREWYANKLKNSK